MPNSNPSACPRKASSILSLSFLVLGASCGSTRPHDPVPNALTYVARVPGIPDARFLVAPGKIQLEAIEASLEPVVQRVKSREEPPSLLAISGGGEHGAFAVGVLTGWTENGDRPEFDIVTGISTGALIGSLAFLGPEYDAELKEAYTTIGDADVFDSRGYLSILRHGDAVASSEPLAELIRKHFDRQKMEKVAAEHRRGRRFYVGTTNMDAEALSVWDIGAIAASGHPDAYDLCCDVLLASASIPVAFPPVFIEVKAGSQTYAEMHVDGGVSNQVFGALALQRVGSQSGKPGGTIYFIRNSRIAAEWKEMEPAIFSIAGRTISQLIKTQGIGDLYRAYIVAQEAEQDFRLASIPIDFEKTQAEGTVFDKIYMQALFDRGYRLAKDGNAWSEHPPYYDEVFPAKAGPRD